jgi:L-threonylcarbamoyladenylate synthase
LTGLDPELCRGLKVGAIVFSKDSSLPVTPQIVLTLSERGALEEVAAKLFAALRELDASGLDLIVVDTCEPIGLGAAIMDRLLRAAHS